MSCVFEIHASIFFPGQDSLVAGHLSLQTSTQKVETSGPFGQMAMQDSKSPTGHGLSVVVPIVVELEKN